MTQFTKFTPVLIGAEAPSTFAFWIPAENLPASVLTGLTDKGVIPTAAVLCVNTDLDVPHFSLTAVIGNTRFDENTLIAVPSNLVKIELQEFVKFIDKSFFDQIYSTIEGDILRIYDVNAENSERTFLGKVSIADIDAPLSYLSYIPAGKMSMQPDVYKVRRSPAAIIHNELQDRVSMDSFVMDDTSTSRKDIQPMNEVQKQFHDFRVVYNACFENGISLAESSTIFIKKAITTLTRDCNAFRHLSIRLESPSVVNNTSPLADLLHSEYPVGFFCDNLFIGLTLEDGKEYPAIAMHDLTVHGNLRTYDIAYLPCEKFDSFFKKLRAFEFKPRISIISISDVGKDGSTVAQEVPYETEMELHPTNFFYPFIAELYGQHVEDFSIEKFVTDFMNSRDNVMIFTGEKGTGKSSLVKEFYLPGMEINSIASADVLAKPDVAKTWRFKPKQDGFRMLTVYDEADHFLMSKESGNTVMGALLAHLDGPVPSREKFIIASNLLSTANIDRRLTRIGRCHLSVIFRKLTAKEANAARESVGLPAYDFTAPNIALVDVLTAGRDNNRKAGNVKFGFQPD